MPEKTEIFFMLQNFSRRSDIGLGMFLSWSDQLINRHVVSNRVSYGLLFVLKILGDKISKF